MARSVRTVIVVVIVACSLPLLPAAASPSRSDRRATPHDEIRVARVLDRIARGSADPARLAMRATALSMLQAAGLPAGVADGGEEIADSILEEAGDLDGDGTDDAIEYRFVFDLDTFEFETTISAVDGESGEAFWSRSEDSFAVVFPAGDLDGGSGEDLLEMTVAIEPLPGAYRWTITHRAIVGFRGPSTMGTIWSRTDENVWTEVYAGSGVAYADVNYTLPFGTADANGDGATDLLIGHLVAGAVYEPATGLTGSTAAALFEFLDGTSGGSVGAFPVTSWGSFPTVSVVPDLTADGRADVAVFGAIPSQGVPQMSVTAFPGSGGPPAWRATFPLQGFLEVLGVEATGDGRGDVLVVDYGLDASGWWIEDSSLRLFSGASGSSAWSSAFPGFAYPAPAGPADGGPGSDLLLVLEHETEEAYVVAHGLLDGATGQVRYLREVQKGYPWIAGDLTADGVGDVLWERDGMQAGQPVTRLTARSGVDGGNAWTRVTSGFAYGWPVFEDLDGDGGMDVVRLTYDPDSGFDAYDLLSGTTGQPWWGQLRTTPGFVWWLDASGDAILESGIDLEDWSDFDGAVAGATGSLRWLRRGGQLDG